MRTRRPLVFESLESRNMLSGSYSQLHHVSSELANTGPVNEAAALTSYELASSEQSMAAETRWDWLAQTNWYVPTENLLAYTTSADLSNPTPIADQTLWYISQSVNRQIAGEAVVKLSNDPLPAHMTFAGVVTDGGQIRIEFSQVDGVPPVTGIGQMRFADGAWRMQMQMATGTSEIVTHWAYMSELSSSTTPPDASDPPPQGSLRADNWRWIEGTNWLLSDSLQFGNGKHSGVFRVDSFRNGYFWGSGTGTQPFNVLGSITPEGNVLLLVSVNVGQPAVRTGILSDGVMWLRTYEGAPAVGSAWLLDHPAGPSARPLLASVLSITH